MKRPTAFAGARRAVIKIGSAVLRDGPDFDRVTFVSLVRDLVWLMNEGVHPIVVCSGAVALGLPRLGLKARPRRIERIQATAAVGQGFLMRLWTDELGHYGYPAAQLLLTHDDLGHRRRFLAARHTLRALIEMGAIPIINENDTVAIEEIKLGDNDLLSSQIVSLVEADLLVILSDIDGLYRDPAQRQDGPIPWVDTIDTEVMTQAGESRSSHGSGGMRTKIEAIHQVNRLGVPGAIINGKALGVLRRLYAGDDVGTWFSADQPNLRGRKHWIAYALRPMGAVHIDAGAAKALQDDGRSLLPIGVVSVDGDFDIGAPVRILAPDGVEVGRGLTGHDAETVRAFAGKHSGGETPLDPPEVVHRDDLVLTDL
jgi:glutamate 5-kinase